MSECSWIFRWLHGRKREADRRFMVPMIIGAARRREADQEWINYGATQAERALAAFRVFTLQPGQEHWLCPCATDERHELEKLLKEEDPDVDEGNHRGLGKETD